MLRKRLQELQKDDKEEESERRSDEPAEERLVMGKGDGRAEEEKQD